MSKRRRTEIEDDGDYTEENRTPLAEDSATRESSPSAEDELRSSAIVSILLRMVMTRSARNQKIRREHFTTILHKHNVKGNTKAIISQVDAELKEVFGLKLDQSTNDIVLISNLQKDTKLLLQKLVENGDGSEFKGNPYDTFYFMNKEKRNETTVSMSDSIFGGIIMLLIGLVIVNENRIRESDLLDGLSQFGFSENLNIVVPNLNKTTQEVLTEATKKEYLQKLVAQAHGGEPAIVSYALGKRTLREFDAHTLLEFLNEIVEQEELKPKCIETVKRCFPDDTFENSASGNNVQS
ncbi:putative Smc5-Smc6 complex subunit [Clavispora lusitaniae]|uniref:Smc5-Smc6 complex subunit n=1 Tax=Clavispora lusitaniae TaxID=36911 RepID=A0AA91PYS4_CLALS|nr:putative Smc5-Smc6 complex subunit [Clavispora lusitaniae]